MFWTRIIYHVPTTGHSVVVQVQGPKISDDSSQFSQLTPTTPAVVGTWYLRTYGRGCKPFSTHLWQGLCSKFHTDRSNIARLMQVLLRWARFVVASLRRPTILTRPRAIDRYSVTCWSIQFMVNKIVHCILSIFVRNFSKIGWRIPNLLVSISNVITWISNSKCGTTLQ